MSSGNSTWKWKRLPRKKQTWYGILRKNHKKFLKNNKLALKSQQRFSSETHHVFTKKGIQSIDSIETHSYETSKDLVCKKEEIKCNNIINNTTMINFDDITRGNIKKSKFTTSFRSSIQNINN